MCGSLFAFTYIEIYNTIFTERSTIITKMTSLVCFSLVVLLKPKLNYLD